MRSTIAGMFHDSHLDQQARRRTPLRAAPGCKQAHKAGFDRALKVRHKIVWPPKASVCGRDRARAAFPGAVAALPPTLPKSISELQSRYWHGVAIALSDVS